MASLSDLKLSKKPLGDDIDLDKIPTERGTFNPPPQPGVYRFKLPAKIDNFDVFQTAKYGERVAVVFDADAPLVITQSKGKAHNGEDYTTRLNNVPRPRGKEGILVSDLDYLLKALGVALPPAKTRTNLDYVKAVVSIAGKEFSAEQEFSYRCDPRRAARFYADDGSLTTIDETRSAEDLAALGLEPLNGDDAGLQGGCGKRYYQSAVPKIEGQQPTEISCTVCGATIRAFGNLRAFKP